MPKDGEKDDPIALMQDWMRDAEKEEPVNPTAVALATSASDGMPSVRMVLLRGLDERGLVFYTNLESRKGHELHDNPKAAMCFYWRQLGRQLRVEGTIELVDDSEADAYFQSRDRGSRIGAWASKQSQQLESRHALEKRVAKFMAKFGVGAVPRPDFWSGYRLNPQRIEFWTQGQFRLHDRHIYERDGDGWKTERLYP